MTIRRLDDQSLAFEGIDPFLEKLLTAMPTSADWTGSDAATARLFPAPSAGREPLADEEWREYVEPGLRDTFREAISLVGEDLAKMSAGSASGPRELRVPARHLDAWIHALNQARLALAARHDLSEAELEREVPQQTSERAFVLFQIHFYGLMQELLLRHEE